MNLELTDSQRGLLADLLEVAYKDKLRELHHTATLAFKQGLKHDIETIEELRAMLTGAHAGGGLPGE